MKILIQSLMFVIIVGLFAVASDRLSDSEPKKAMAPSTETVADSEMSDQEFLINMIAHHEEAIKMAKGILLPTDRQEIHDLASNIIAKQTKEIELMQQWRRDWYGK